MESQQKAFCVLRFEVSGFVITAAEEDIGTEKG
jgi:hypothetical protein